MSSHWCLLPLYRGVHWIQVYFTVNVGRKFWGFSCIHLIEGVHLTHWLLELFAKNAFLDILVFFKLDLRQISFNPVENAFATQQLSFLVTSIAFYPFVTQACTEIKILKLFLDEKVTYVFRLFDFWNFFFAFLFSPFLFFLLQWLTFYRACLWLKNF